MEQLDTEKAKGGDEIKESKRRGGRGVRSCRDRFFHITVNLPHWCIIIHVAA